MSKFNRHPLFIALIGAISSSAFADSEADLQQLATIVVSAAGIERIEVIRGPMATRYGSEAMGGVINIITKKVTDEWAGNVTVSGNIMENNQEADSWKTSFVINGPLINNILGLQLRGSYLDRQKSQRIPGTAGRDPRPSEADNYDIGGKLDFKLNDQNSFWVDAFQSRQTYKNNDNRLGTLDWTTNTNDSVM